jgi:hypothetical protein
MLPLCALLLLLRVSAALRVFHVSLRDPNNIGDVYSSPLK